MLGVISLVFPGNLKAVRRVYTGVGIKENIMSKEGIEGATQKGVGSMKEAAGKLTGNKKLQAEGLADRATGAAKEGIGKMKDKIHKATE